MIIGIAGQAGAGKSTLANMLCKKLNAVEVAQADPLKRFCQEVFRFTNNQLWGPSECRNAVDERYGFDANAWQEARVRFQGVFTSFIKDCFETKDFIQAEAGLDRWFRNLRPEPLTPRIALQTLGTEWGRAIKPTVWVDLAIKNAEKRLCGIFDAVVISDIRFRNELVQLRKTNSFLIRIHGDDDGNVDLHQSEQELEDIPNWWFDSVIQNNKEAGIECLEVVADDILTLIRNLPAKYYVEE